MAVPPPPGGNDARVFFFPLGNLSLCNRKHESDQNPTYFPEGSFREKKSDCVPEYLWPGGVLPYITYTGMCRPTGSWFWSSWFRTGYPFQRSFLERGIIFRTHESSSTPDDYEEAFIWCISRTNKEVSFFKKTGLFQFTNFLQRSIKNWPISRTGYQFSGTFFLEQGANLESGEAHTHPKNTQVPPRDLW